MFQRRLDTNRLPQSCKLRPQFFHCKSNWKGWVTTVQATMLRTPLLDIILFWIYFFEGTTIYVACSFFVPISHAAGRIRRDTSWGTIDGPCRKTETWQPAIFSNIFVEWKRKLVWTRRGGFLEQSIRTLKISLVQRAHGCGISWSFQNKWGGYIFKHISDWPWHKHVENP